MTDFDLPQDMLEAYSAARLTRREMADRHDREVSFGDLLMALRAHGLPLPHYPSDPNSPGVQLVRQLAERAARGTP